MFNVLYRDQEGRNFVLECLNVEQKDNFIRALDNAGISYSVIEREDRKIQVISVIFNLDDTKTYTFEDPKKLAKIGDIVEVECTDGRHKNALVKAAGMRTKDEINAFCAKIGYKSLGTTTKLVWSSRK